MFGLFEDPKCPTCGRPARYTGASFPYPEWRCDHCCKENREKREREDEMKKLKQRVAQLEDKSD